MNRTSSSVPAASVFLHGGSATASPTAAMVPTKPRDTAVSCTDWMVDLLLTTVAIMPRNSG